jgi:hypothetical protein
MIRVESATGSPHGHTGGDITQDHLAGTNDRSRTHLNAFAQNRAAASAPWVLSRWNKRIRISGRVICPIVTRA